MKSNTKEERADAPEWMFIFPETRSAIIDSQQAAYLAPSRIGHLPPVKRRIAELRAVRAIMRQNFKLPKRWEHYETGKKETVTMSQQEREQERRAAEALRQFADVIDGRVDAARFDDRADEIAEAEARRQAQRQAEEFARQVNARLPSRVKPPHVPSGFEELREAQRAAEEFAERQNRRMRNARK